MPNKVFISYRREDSRYQARRVYDAFVQALPPDTVFMDVDSIPPGADFVEILEGWVQQCDVLLALIGPTWLKSIDPRTKRRRLDSPEDFVRIEVRGALARNIPVVPVLLDAAEMPTAAELPDDVKALRRRHAEFVDFRTFDADVQRLIKRLKIGKEIELPGEAREPRAGDGGSRHTGVAAVKSLLERLKPNAVIAKPPLLVAAAAAALLLAVATVAYVMNTWTHVDASAGLAELAKAEESRRAAETRASQATDALAIAVKARQEAEATASAAATAQAKSEEARQAAEARSGEAADALTKSEKARREAEAAAAAARAAQAKSEEGRRAAETRAGEADKVRQEAETKATAAVAALTKTDESRRAAEARASEAAETLKKSDKARIEAESRASSAATAQAKAEDAQRTAEKARFAAETAATIATTAKTQADASRQYAEVRANDAVELAKKAEKARQEAEARLAAQTEELRKLTAARTDPAPAASSSSSSSRKLLTDAVSRGRWARNGKLNCFGSNNPDLFTLEVGNGTIAWVDGKGSRKVEKLVAAYENSFYTDQHSYSRSADNTLYVQASDITGFFLERCQ